MGWQDDLADLVGEVTGNVAGSAVGQRVGDVAGSAVGQAAGRGIGLGGDFLEALAVPVKWGTGLGIGAINEGLGMLPGQQIPLGPFPGIKYEPGTSEALHGQRDWWSGPMAAFEEVRADEPMAFQFATEPFFDPATYLGGWGVGRKAAGLALTGARAAELAGRPVVAGGLRGAARGAQATQFIWNDALDMGIARVGRTAPMMGLKRGARGTVQRIMPGAFDLAPEFDHGLEKTGWTNAWTREQQAAGGPPQPTLAPIGEPTGIPLVPHPHPPGSAPARLYERAALAVTHLWRGGPGKTPGPLGIVHMSREHGVPTSVAHWTDGDLQFLVDISLGNMQAIADETQLFGSVRRTAVEAPAWRDRMVADFGDDVIPMLPAIWNRMRKEIPELPDARFVGTHGYALKGVGTDRLDVIQKRMDMGQLTRAEALKQIADFPMGSPEAVEAAAAHGAALFTQMRTGGTAADFRPGGTYFPQESQLTGPLSYQRAGATPEFRKDVLGEANAPGVVPHAVPERMARLVDQDTVPFGSNRMAWDAHMQQQFGQMAQDELDTLANMSIDILYETYVNAANDYALGGVWYAKGKLGDYTDDAAGRAALRAYAGERGKVGTRATRPTQRAGSLGQQLLAGNVNIKRPHIGGQIGDKAAWSEQLRQHLGKDGPITREDLNGILGQTIGKRDFTGAEVEAALRKVGRTPVERNPTGGLMPALEEMLDDFEAGKNLTISRTGVTAQHLFKRGVEEMAMIVGTGQPRKAKLLLHFAALTSSATGVQRNMKLALRMLAEWEWGQDTTLLKEFGLHGPEFEQVMNDGLLHAGLREDQRRPVERLLNAARDGRTSPLDIQGAKLGNLATSFMSPMWRKQLDDYANKLGASKLSRSTVREITDAFERANLVFAPDRHISRYDSGPTVLNALQQLITRERGVIAARAAGVPTEEMHAALWYISRDLQGTTRVHGPETDFAAALQKVIGRMWNENRPPDTNDWNAFLREVSEKNGGLEGEDLYTEAYQAGKQQIFYSIIADALKDTKVKKALKTAGLPQTIGELSRDMMGIVSRGAHGLYPDEWATPLGATQVDGLSRVVEVNAGVADPVVMQFRDGAWAPVTGAGYAVPVMPGGSYGIGQTTTARKALEKLITKPVVADAFDPGTGDRTAQLAIGQLPNRRGSQQIGLYALTPDPATAEMISRRAGATHIFDVASGTSIPQPGGTRTKSLPSLLDEFFGPAEPFPRPSLEEARRRGITMAEADTKNPTSLFMSRLYEPFMDAYNALNDEGLDLMDARTIDDLNAPSWGGDDGGLTRRGYNPAISSPDNEMLLRTVQDGTTYREVIATYKAEGEIDKRVLEEAGAHWRASASLPDRLDAVNQDPDLSKIINRWHQRGIDPLFATPDQMGLGMLDKMVRKQKGLKHVESTVPALLVAAWGEMVLASGKYLTGNVVGNWIAAALQGTYIPLTPNQYNAALKTVRNGADQITAAEAKRSLKGEQIHNFWGESMPQEIFRGGPREVNSNAARYSPSPTGELVGRAGKRIFGEKVGGAIGRKVGSPLVLLADVGTAAEVVARSSLESDQFDRNMWEMIPVWEAEVRQAGSAIPGFEFSIQDSINTPAGGLYPEALRDKLTELGISDGRATRLMRDYVNIKHKARSDAIAVMNRALFSYDKTNFDEFIGNFVPFTYWYSRAGRYYFEEAIRHPFLITNYMRSQEGIEAAQQDPGLSARQKGFINLFGTPLGFSLLMNPEALLGTAKVLNMEDSYEPDGLTSMGGVLLTLRKYGLGLYPWIGETMNLMGMYGNTFEPDLLGIRHKALVGAAINFVGAHAGFEPAGAPYADAMGQLRYSVSSFVDSFTPDWLAQTVTPRAGGSSQEASLDVTIENIILDANPTLSNQELLDIMVDPDSEQYKQAFRIASEAGLVQQLMNVTLPVNFRMRHDARDVRSAQRETVFEAAAAAGQSPYEFAPRPDDLAFKAKYQALTGAQWRPGDYKNAMLKNDLARAPVEAKQFILDDATFNDLGGTRGQRAFERYTAILYGDDPVSAGVTDPGVRRELANQWADRHRGMARAVENQYAIRDTFTSTHPQYAEYKDWSSRVRNLAPLYGGTLAEYRRQVSQANPNAARYFAQKEAWMQANVSQGHWPEERDKFTVSAAAFHAITGRGTASETSAGGSPSRMEQGPIPGYPGADVALPMMEPPPPMSQGNGYAEDWVRQAESVGRQYGVRQY